MLFKSIVNTGKTEEYILKTLYSFYEAESDVYKFLRVGCAGTKQNKANFFACFASKFKAKQLI